MADRTPVITLGTIFYTCFISVIIYYSMLIDFNVVQNNTKVQNEIHNSGN